jgi:hypothetical protein
MATMANFLLRAEDVLKRLERLLAHFQAMLTQQRADAGGAALLKQILHAQTVLTNRRRDLRVSLDDRDVDRFIHELWALGGDMAHFDFDLSHLAGAYAFSQLREEISLDALVLTKDLTDPANRAAFVAELAAHP